MSSLNSCRNCTKNKAAFDQELEHLALSAQQEIIRLKAVLQTTEDSLKTERLRAEVAEKCAEIADTKLKGFEALLLSQAAGGGTSNASAAALSAFSGALGGAERKFPEPSVLLSSGRIAAVQPFVAGQPDKVLTNDDMQLDNDDVSTPGDSVDKEPTVHPRRTVLEHFSSEIFGDKYPLLPPDWTEFWHESGIPIYKHLPSGVYTLARPFNADTFPKTALDCVPISGVPCFYWRVVQNWAKNRKETEHCSAQPEQASVGEVPPADKPGYRPTDFLTMEQLRVYAEGSFEFTTEPFSLPKKVKHPVAGVVQYDKFVQLRTDEKGKQLAMLAASKARKQINVEVPGTRKFVSLDADLVEPEAILKEFSAKANLPLNFEEKNSAAAEFSLNSFYSEFLPYKVIVKLGDTNYGSAAGMDAKQAMFEACARTVEELIPGYKPPPKRFGPFAVPSAPEHVAIFATMAIDDPQVSNLTENLLSSNPVMKKFSPLTLFAEFLRKYPERFSETSLRHEFRTTSYSSRGDFWLRLNEVEVLVPCYSVQEGKALAVQKMLGKFHPNLKTWGALVRTYIPTSALCQPSSAPAATHSGDSYASRRSPPPRQPSAGSGSTARGGGGSSRRDNNSGTGGRSSIPSLFDLAPSGSGIGSGYSGAGMTYSERRSPVGRVPPRERSADRRDRDSQKRYERR